MNTTHEAGRLTDAELSDPAILLDDVDVNLGAVKVPYFTADQMREYAQSAVLARAQGEAVAWYRIQDNGSLTIVDMSKKPRDDYSPAAKPWEPFRTEGEREAFLDGWFQGDGDEEVAPTPAQEPQPVQSGAVRDWSEVNKKIGEYVEDYEYDDGESGLHAPGEFERHVIYDAIMGLLSEDWLIQFFETTRAAPAVEVAEGRETPVQTIEAILYQADRGNVSLPWLLNALRGIVARTPGAASDAVRQLAMRIRAHAETHVDCATGHEQLVAIADEVAALATTPSAEAVDAARLTDRAISRMACEAGISVGKKDDGPYPTISQLRALLRAAMSTTAPAGDAKGGGR